MTVRELLETCRTALDEIMCIERQIDKLESISIAPSCTLQIKREKIPGRDEYVLQPSNTNNTAAAREQHIDGYKQMLRSKTDELSELMIELERLLGRLDDGKARLILRYYYGIGWTDEKIADELEMTRPVVNFKRNAAVDYLENIAV